MNNKNDKEGKSSRVGLYTTLIFHLVVIIFLLASSISSLTSRETSFVLDFSKQEKIEKEKEVMEMKEKVSKELDQLLAASRNNSNVRNVAVDANSKHLKDDRHKNPNQVYNEHEELQRKLDAAKRQSQALDKQDAENYANLNKKDNSKSSDDAQSYQGPSVISYSLDGRKAHYLPVPAYKGYGSGDVAVMIFVNRKGRVTDAKIIEGASSNEPTLRSFAISAAKRSRFTASATAVEPQQGEIVYRFIGQ